MFDYNATVAQVSKSKFYCLFLLGNNLIHYTLHSLSSNKYMEQVKKIPTTARTVACMHFYAIILGGT